MGGIGRPDIPGAPPQGGWGPGGQWIGEKLRQLNFPGDVMTEAVGSHGGWLASAVAAQATGKVPLPPDTIPKLYKNLRDPDPVTQSSRRIVADVLAGNMSIPDAAGALRDNFETRPLALQMLSPSPLDIPLPVAAGIGAGLKGIQKILGPLRRGRAVPSTALAVREPVEAAAAEGLRRVPTTEELQRAGFGTTPPPSRVLTTPAPSPATPLPGGNQPVPYFSDVLEPVVAPSRATPAEMAQELGTVLPETAPPSAMPLGSGIPARAAPTADELGIIKERSVYYPKDVDGYADISLSPIHKAVIDDQDRYLTWLDYPDLGKNWYEYTGKGTQPGGSSWTPDPGGTGIYTKKELIAKLEAEAATEAAQRTEVGISSALEMGKYGRWWTKESEEGRRKAESLMQSTDPAEHAQGVEDYNDLVAAPIRFLTDVLEKRGYEGVRVQANFGYFGELEPSFRASVKSADSERLMADIAEIADVEFRQTSVLVYEPTTENVHRYFRGAAGAPDYSIEPIYSFRTTGGQEISGKQWSEIQKLMGGRRHTPGPQTWDPPVDLSMRPKPAWEGELELPGFSSHADGKGFDIIHVSKYGYDVTAPKNVGYDSVRKWIARVGTFAEELKTNNDLRGILDTYKEGFRKLRHYGNPEDWGDWAPHIRGNTADPKHSYRWYANYYAAKSPPSGIGTGAGRALEELPSPQSRYRRPVTNRELGSLPLRRDTLGRTRETVRPPLRRVPGIYKDAPVSQAPVDVPTTRIPPTEELQRASLGTGLRRVRAELPPVPMSTGRPGLTPQQPSARPRGPLTMGASSAWPRPPVPSPQRVPAPDISLYDQAYAGQEALRKFGLPARATRAQAAQAVSEAPDTAATIARGGGEIPPGTPAVADPGSLPPSASNVMDRISFDEPRQRLLDRFRSGLAGLKRAIADDLHPIDRFVTVSKELGSEVSLEENPYIWARLLRGISGKSNTFLEKGTFGKRYWKTEGGRAVPDFKGPGLYQILESVRDAGNHQAFSTYLTARRAVELADKGIVTGITKQDALKSIAELDRANPGFRGTAQQVYKYQDDLIEYARESGLLSNDMVARLRTYKDYVPFHRVMDSMETQGFTGNKMANIVSPIKRMKGSERRIIHPLESIIKNTHALIEAADRNQVGVMMARMASESPELQSLFKAKKAPVSKVAKVNAKELGIDISGLSEADANMLVDIFRPATYAKNANEVTVMINGQKRFFDVDPDLYKSLTNIDQVDLGLFGKFFGAPARWLRAGAVLSPDFMVKNPIRDQLTAFVYSKFGFLPGIDWMKGMGQMLNKSDDYHMYRMSGAEHSNLVSVDRAMTGRTVKEIAEEKGFTDYIKNPVDLLRTLSEVGEKGTRLGEFSRALSAGESPMAAGFSAREVSQDFSKMGVVTRAVNQIIPFFGAKVGGWTRAKTAFTERPIQSSAKAFLGITLPSILLYSINRNDPRYKEIPQWQKDTFWIIPTPNAMLRFPKPFLVGQVFGSVPERFLEFLDERDPEMLAETLKSVVGEGVPGWAPQAVLPFVENATNHNFFLDRPVVPRDREDAPKEMQYSGRTTEAAKALGKWVNLSPAQIDNVFYAYTGGLGRYVADSLDPALKAIGIADRIADPDPTLADLPILRSFVVRDPYGSSGVSVDKFYDALKDFEGQEKMYKELIALGRQDAVVKYKDSHPSAGLGFDYKYGGVHYSATARALRRVAGTMSDIRKYQRGVYNSRTMSGAEKRSNIDASNKQLTLLAQKALADLEKILP